MEQKKKLAKTLTGDYKFGENSKNSVIERTTNANVEGKEWIEDAEGVKKLEGKRHSQGGMDIVMESGDRVLTDYTKISKELAKNLTSLGIKVSPKDTYSKVLDKYNKHIGLQTITDEEEKYNKRLLDLEGKVKDKTTAELNTQVLTNKINDLQEEKESLLVQREELFNFLYEDQESRKPQETKDTFQRGGGLTRSGIITKSVEDAVKKWNRDRGVGFGTVSPTFRNPEDWQQQRTVDPITGTFGPGFATDEEGRLAEMQEIFPNNFNQNLEGQVSPENIAEYQRAMNEDRTRQIQDVAETFGIGSPEYNDFVKRNAPEMFTEDGSVFAVDSKLGDVTSQKLNNTYNTLPPEEYSRLKDQGITSVGQLLETPEGREIANRYYPNVDPSWGIGPAQIPLSEDGQPLQDSARTPLDIISNINVNPVGRFGDSLEDQEALRLAEQRERQSGWDDLLSSTPRLPDRTPLAPGNVLPHLKTNPELNLVNPERATSGEGLKELNRQRLMMMSNTEGMNPQARALALIAGSGNLQRAVEGIMSKTEDVNASNRNRADMINKQSRDIFARERDASAMNYEARTYKAEGLRDKEWRGYYRSLARQNAQDWNTIEKINAYNELNPNFRYENGKIVTKNGQIFIPQGVYQAPTEKRKTTTKK